MLRRAMQKDLPELARLRAAAYGETPDAAAAWLQQIAGLEHVLVVETGEPPVLQAQLAVIPLEQGRRHGVWFAGMLQRGPGLPERLLADALRACAAGGYDFAVVLPRSRAMHDTLGRLGFVDAFALRVLQKPIRQNLLAQADFDTMTVRRLQESRQRYQPGSILLPDECLTGIVKRLYSQGVTIVANRRGYGLYYSTDTALQFIELQADNDHAADLLLQAARNKTGITAARVLLAESQALYLGMGRRQPYGMIRFLQQPFPTGDLYFRPLL